MHWFNILTWIFLNMFTQLAPRSIQSTNCSVHLGISLLLANFFSSSFYSIIQEFFWIFQFVGFWSQPTVDQPTVNQPTVDNRGGSVAVGGSDRWHVTGYMWHMTCDTWHMTWEIFFFFFSLLFWYWCYHPHWERDSLSSKCWIFCPFLNYFICSSRGRVATLPVCSLDQQNIHK